MNNLIGGKRGFLFNKRFLRYGPVCGLLVFFPTFAFAEDETADSYRELESKYIFGFTLGSDFGAEGERELESETNIAFRKRTGSYGQLGQEVELEYNPTDSTEIEVAAHGVSTWISGVEGLDDRHGANFGGLSSVFRYLVIGRGPGAPVGLQIAVEPEWSRVDDAGKLTTAFAAGNLDHRRHRACSKSSLRGVQCDLHSGDRKGIWDPGLAGSVHAWAEDGFDLPDHVKYDVWRRTRIFPRLRRGRVQSFRGDALFVGPTCFILFTNKLFLSAAFSTQIAGHAAGDANFLDLTDFTRNKARLKLVWEF